MHSSGEKEDFFSFQSLIIDLSKALMDQHQTITPVVFNEILMSKVSETTGQLVEPVKR